MGEVRVLCTFVMTAGCHGDVTVVEVMKYHCQMVRCIESVYYTSWPHTLIIYLFIYLFIYCHLYSAFSIVQCSNALYRL